MTTEPYQCTFFESLTPDRRKTYLNEFKRGFQAGMRDMPSDSLPEEEVNETDMDLLLRFFRTYPSSTNAMDETGQGAGLWH